MTNQNSTGDFRLISKQDATTLISGLMSRADTSGDPEGYWGEAISMVAASMAAHLSHDQAARALDATREAMRVHREQIQTANH